MPQTATKDLFQQMWDYYSRQNPQVPVIHRLISEREGRDELYNDHIALRTFQHPRVGLDVLARAFQELGFEAKDEFELTDKHVFAKYYRHPDDKWPRVFISELKINELSAELQDFVDQMVQEIPQVLIDSNKLCSSGRAWKIAYSTYEQLRAESEYAAWMSAHGFQMNHATLSVNALTTFETLDEIIEFLKQHQLTLNGEADGHEIQEARDAEEQILLRQASTLASKIKVNFSDGTFEVPGCYYEFLQRFHGYDSFDPGNATKIMESTDVR